MDAVEVFGEEVPEDDAGCCSLCWIMELSIITTGLETVTCCTRSMGVV